MANEQLRTLFGEPHLEALGNGSWKAEVTLQKEHPIYAGHFPGRPVTPGVAQVQLIEQLVSKVMGKRMMLRGSKAIKFLRPIDPNEHDRLVIHFRLGNEGPDVPCEATAEVNGTKVFSMRAELRPIP